ncbi:MAG: HAD-IIB family hydrolase [Candidatus Fimenecus sp.]
MKTLYISDMDGTLLQSDGTLSEYTKQKINEFYEKGVLFSVATARSFISAEPLLKGTNFSVPIVLMNGVFVYDTEENRAVKYHEIPLSSLKEIFSAFYEHNLHPFMFLYGDDGNLSIKYTEFDNEMMIWFYNARVDMLGGRFTKADDLTEIPKGQHPVYINYYAPYEILCPVAEKIKGIKGVSFAFYKDSYSDDWLIEIYSAEASKTNGAREVKEYAKADSITAFGDNLNDILLLENADCAVAVENAVSEIKEIADVVIGDNNSDSVVIYIEQRENATNL